MKLSRIFFTALLIALFVVPPVMASDFSDSALENDSNSLTAPTPITYTLDGPYNIKSIERTDDKTLKITYTEGKVYSSTVTSRQNTCGIAMCNNSPIFLYLGEKDGVKSVYGIVVLTD